MREVLSLHIGQAGVQMGNGLWELFCAEHCVTEDGKLFDSEAALNERIETFFTLNPSPKYIPRCLFVDLEPTVIDEIRVGAYRLLFHPDRLMAGPEDAASNFARGFFTIGKLLLTKINHEIRKMFESAGCVQGIMIYRSLGGGTGAGLTSAIFDGLSEFPKTPKIDIPIYPSPALSSSTVEPYNSILAEHFCMEDVDVGLLFDNEALYDICSKFLGVTNPTYGVINRLVSQLCACITASIRFENVLNCDLTVLQTNLVPYPRIHFPLCNYSPLVPASKSLVETFSVKELTHSVFDRDNQMVKVDPSYGRFMSCALFYRGGVSPQQVHLALTEIKKDKTIDFVEWCPTGFKVGINPFPPICIPQSYLGFAPINLAMLTNSSAIGQAWQRLSHKFYLLYAKRSFLHWFVGEGMEECEFTEALYNISTLVKDYEEVSLDASGPNDFRNTNTPSIRKDFSRPDDNRAPSIVKKSDQRTPSMLKKDGPSRASSVVKKDDHRAPSMIIKDASRSEENRASVVKKEPRMSVKAKRESQIINE